MTLKSRPVPWLADTNEHTTHSEHSAAFLALLFLPGSKWWLWLHRSLWLMSQQTLYNTANNGRSVALTSYFFAVTFGNFEVVVPAAARNQTHVLVPHIASSPTSFARCVSNARRGFPRVVVLLQRTSGLFSRWQIYNPHFRSKESV